MLRLGKDFLPMLLFVEEGGRRKLGEKGYRQEVHGSVGTTSRP
jgi:hypothetical protein